MDNLREKLVDLIIDAKRTDPETGSFTEHLADHLIANDVTVRERISDEDRLTEFNASRTKVLEQFDHVHAAGGCYCGECLGYLSVNHYQGEGICVATKRPVSTKDFCSLGRPAK